MVGKGLPPYPYLFSLTSSLRPTLSRLGLLGSSGSRAWGGGFFVRPGRCAQVRHGDLGRAHLEDLPEPQPEGRLLLEGRLRWTGS